MSAKNTHPSYSEMREAWELGRDSDDGEPAIKAKGTQYLPATSGQKMDGQGSPGTPGDDSYNAYKTRAVYPTIYGDAVEAAIGIMHRKPPKIELPSVLEGMFKRATTAGETLEMLLRRINARQLITGRLGILGDIRLDKDNKPIPVIAIYNELAIRNWDDTSVDDEDMDLRLVVLDESGYELTSNLEWVFKSKYRVLALVEGDGESATFASQGMYKTTVFNEGDEVVASRMQAPSVMGDTLDSIPFSFINSKDIASDPDRPPLDGLANLCLAIYRGEADYRQNLFMQGQDTLILIGRNSDDEQIRVGAGAHIDVGLQGDAKFIGTNSGGLPEQRTALENDYSRALQKSGQLTDATSRAKESGDALRIRVAAQAATLPQIAMAGAAGLERVLRALAQWLGGNPDEVVVEPNLEFSNVELDSKTLLDIVSAKELGAPVSQESIHNWMREKGITDMEFAAELAKIMTEAPLIGSADEEEETPPAGPGNGDA